MPRWLTAAVEWLTAVTLGGVTLRGLIRGFRSTVRLVDAIAGNTTAIDGLTGEFRQFRQQVDERLVVMEIERDRR